jgi:hypothetical protein
MIRTIPNMNDIIPSVMSFTMRNNTHTSNIVSSSYHGNITDIKFNKAGDFVGFQIKADGVANFDERVWVTNRSGVVSDEVGDSSFTKLHTFDFAEFVFSFFGGDAVDCEATFNIVNEPEMFVCLINGNNVLYKC